MVTHDSEALFEQIIARQISQHHDLSLPTVQRYRSRCKGYYFQSLNSDVIQSLIDEITSHFEQNRQQPTVERPTFSRPRQRFFSVIATEEGIIEQNRQPTVERPTFNRPS